MYGRLKRPPPVICFKIVERTYDVMLNDLCIYLILFMHNSVTNGHVGRCDSARVFTVVLVYEPGMFAASLGLRHILSMFFVTHKLHHCAPVAPRPTDTIYYGYKHVGLRK